MQKKFWLEIPNHFPSIELDEFIIMPNHIHGILIIKKMNNISGNPVQTPKLGVCTGMQNNNKISKNPYWKTNSIGSIINQYKRICTITIKRNGYTFEWHSRYYDHIIRNKKELSRIRKYIRENPKNWIVKNTRIDE